MFGESAISLALLELIREHALEITAVSVASFVISIAFVIVFLTHIPPTYFQDSHDRNFMAHHPVPVRWVVKVIKNFLGAIIVLCGLVMAIPGVPGQGLLTIVVGLTLLDFPGKRRYERKLLRRPAVFSAINRTRQRFSKPPLILD